MKIKTKRTKTGATMSIKAETAKDRDELTRFVLNFGKNFEAAAHEEKKEPAAK